MTNKYIYITLLTVLGFNAEALAKELQASGAPKLVVSITIDQLRSDYLKAFIPLYSDKGFMKLMENGKVYDNASYPFTPIDRASASATITSGATPYYNSIIGERWLNRKTLRPMTSVDDSKYTGLGTTDTTSPARLSTSTLGDELKVATSGKAMVYAIAPFRDASVLSGGHAADGAFWIDDNGGTWCSSTYYFKAMPVWVQAFNKLNAPALKIEGTSWEPFSLYTGSFSYFMQIGEHKPFKHRFQGNQKYQAYKTSALINTDLTDMALQCLASTGMGNDKVTDLLSITYYAGTFEHKTVTNCHMELQDTYIRLDKELARLVEHLENRFGSKEVLIMLTSTGYCDEETSDYNAYRIPTGTFYMNRTASLMNMYLGAIWGPDHYVETIYRNQIFLNHQLLETKKISLTEAMNRSQEFLAMLSGVRNVYTSLQLLTAQNEQILKVRNGFNPENCGDIVIETAPGWRILNEDTQESELSRASLIQFPIIFYGANVSAERIISPVTADRIAPTLAHSIRIRAPNACSAEPLF